MLKQLRIQNIVLVEEAELDFSEGFTVLSGESGAGKSAILKALGLVLGERADSRLLRSGAKRARVEAAFNISQLPGVSDILAEAGIDHEADELLIVRRDLLPDGKSRAYLNNTLAQVALLKRLGSSLIELVSQHSSLHLASPDYQLDVLDLFGGLLHQRHALADSWQALCQRKRDHQSLVNGEAERLREIDRLRAELEELREAAAGESAETLGQEHDRLAHAEELKTLVTGVLEGVEQETPLRQAQETLTRAAALDATLVPQKEGLASVLVELREVAYSLQDYCSHLEGDPARLAHVDEQLALLHRVEKKYGDPHSYQNKAEVRLAKLEEADVELDEIEATIARGEKRCEKLAQELSSGRKKAAEALQKALVGHLHPLNLKDAQFEVRLIPCDRTTIGDERVEFTFAPNLGEGALPVSQCASGGELSRLLLALKTTLAGLELTPTLVFDEIDAALGGETARLVGEKLKAVADGRQVICITHLPQVARLAAHHFQIHKSASDGRTRSQVRPLVDEERKAELARMLGGEVLSQG